MRYKIHDTLQLSVCVTKGGQGPRPAANKYNNERCQPAIRSHGLLCASIKARHVSPVGESESAYLSL